MDYESALRMLKAHGQEHILRFYGELSPREQAVLLSQVETIDWEMVSHFEKPENLSGTGKIEPISAMELAEIRRRRTEFFRRGAESIGQGKVGAVMLAGGQGTRLGSDVPKGAVDIGITRPLYIFEQLIRNLSEVCAQCGAFVPLLIMTSEKNDVGTREFLAAHQYFGYPADFVRFFRQEMAPGVDERGKLLLESKGSLALSPNGNGGWYGSLVRAGLDEELKARGVEWLNVFAVDNVLQRIADPVFLGATVLSGKRCGAKVVCKSYPEERVGVLCLENGKPAVIEYYELTEEMANKRDASGGLLYRYGVILNYLFRTDALREMADRRIPVHVVKKKIPCLDEAGKLVFPERENGYKFETLVVDMVRAIGDCLPFEAEREREFAPIKNRTGEDSVETARLLLEKNGVKL